MGMTFAPLLFWGHRKLRKPTKTSYLHTHPVSLLYCSWAVGCGESVVLLDLWGLLAWGRALGLSWDTKPGFIWAGTGARDLAESQRFLIPDSSSPCPSWGKLYLALLLKLKLQYFDHLMWRDPDAGKDWGQEEKGTTEDEMVGWHHRLDGHVWISSGNWWWTGRPGVLWSMGLQRVGHDWATELNRTLRKNWFWRITFYSKSFVYAPSPRLLKLKALFSQSIALIFFCVSTSLRKQKQNSHLPEWREVWLLSTGNTG